MPHYIRLKSRAPFAFAGLWETWHPPDTAPVRSCTIVTTTPNSLMAEIHNRMPVILPARAFATWLDPEAHDPNDDSDHLANLLRPYPADEMEAYPVSRLVNTPMNERSECIEPARDAGEAPHQRGRTLKLFPE